MIQTDLYGKILLLALLLVCTGFNAQIIKTENFNQNWRFKFKNTEGNLWQPVNLPHDWAIYGPFDPQLEGRTAKLPWQNTAVYEKDFVLPENFKISLQTVYLQFDGIMANPKVYVNNRLTGSWDYGYASFNVDITPFLLTNSKNTIRVEVNTKKHASRWYPGAGIYRDVTLRITGKQHIKNWGTYITTPIVSDSLSSVYVFTEIKSPIENKNDFEIQTKIIAPDGSVIESKTSTLKKGQNPENLYLNQQFKIQNPKLWNTKNPNLYKVNQKLYRKNQLTDQYEQKFGIRSIDFDKNEGFILNGKQLTLQGVCMHHDNGPLGAVYDHRAAKRKIELLKNIGVNAIRTSHNICSPRFLNLCDEEGILVFNEAFDKWDSKIDLYPEDDFYNYMSRNIRNFVLRDRNHPSVIIWSYGNEMRATERLGQPDMLEKLLFVNAEFKRYDSTRPTTFGFNSTNSDLGLPSYQIPDVHSWNYGNKYLNSRKYYPSKPLIYSESSSVISSRGFYQFPLPENKLEIPYNEEFQANSYDINVGWPVASPPDEEFMGLDQNPYVAGEFVWTGFDYLGEPHPFYINREFENGIKVTRETESRSSHYGIFDLCGFPKDRAYLYRSRWLKDSTTVHLLPHWNWEGHEGKKIPVFVYTNGDSAELFLNGKSLGIQAKNKTSTNARDRYRLRWDVPFIPGKLETTAYLNGKKIGEDEVKTAGKPERLSVSHQIYTDSINSNQLAFIKIEARDSKGNFCPLANNELKIKVSGKAKLVGIGNGNPQSYHNFKGDQVALFNGMALLIVEFSELSNIHIKSKTIKDSIYKLSL